MKTALWIISLALFPLLPYAQNSPDASPTYTFKENRLGMSKAEFLQANGGWNLWVTTGKSNAFGKGGKKHLEPTPFCSDRLHWDGDIELEHLKDREVVCDPSPSFANPEGVEINGRRVERVRYHFYNDRLFEITISFDSSRFEEIAGSFRQKYGDPTATKDQDFQNSYGAHWSGKYVTWKSGFQRIAIVEGSGNGPESRFGGLSLAEFQDVSLTPPPDSQSKPDF